MLVEAQQLKNRMTPADYLHTVHGRSLLEKELDSLLSEETDPQHKEVVAFQKRIIRYKDHVFTFLFDPAVPSHKNDSETAIRNVKVKQKVSGQFKSLTGAGNFAILRSIIDTAIKNKQDVLNALNVVAHYKRDCLVTRIVTELYKMSMSSKWHANLCHQFPGNRDGVGT